MATRAERLGYQVVLCKSCGRRIFFAVDIETGRRLPFDASVPVYIVVASADDSRKPRARRILHGFLPHHANCTNPERHRNAKGGE